MEARVLYVHVAADGGLLAIAAETGRSSWVTMTDLARRVSLVGEAGGRILLSQDGSSAIAATAAAAIASYALVERTASVHTDSIRTGGLTSLMSAAYLGANDLLEDLLLRGAKFDTGDSDGFTALMYAANGGQLQAVRLLIRSGADPRRTDKSGATALMFGAQIGDLGIVKCLVAIAADVVVFRDANGMRARDYAAQNGHEGVASVLLSLERGETRAR